MVSLREIVAFHLGPIAFLLTSLSHLPATLLAPRDATSPSFRESWFLRFWTSVSPSIREGSGARVTALLQGRVSGGTVTDGAKHEAVGGTVLEIGAGTGVWAGLLAGQPGVERVYGVEPNAASLKVLRGTVEKEGVGEKYVVVPAGIEDAGRWVERGSVDCVVTVLCMCGIPEPDRIAKEVYGYLKPGGRWYVFEHVRADGVGWWMSLYQGKFLFSPLSFLHFYFPPLFKSCLWFPTCNGR